MTEVLGVQYISKLILLHTKKLKYVLFTLIYDNLSKLHLS